MNGPAIALFNVPDLLREIGDASVTHGRSYQRERRVLKARMDPDSLLVTGEVRGSGSHRYRQRIQLTPRESGIAIDGECSCPVGHNCKHVAAVLLEVLRLGWHSAHASKPLATKTGSELSPVLPSVAGEIDEWLARVRAAAQPAGNDDAYDERVRHRLLYVLERGRNGSATQVVFFTAFRKQDGSYGKINPYRGNLYAIASAPQAYLVGVDKAIISGLLTLSYQTDNGSALTGEAGADLLRRMVATGRCHWADPLNAPLNPGEPISAKLLWRFDTDGSQKPGIDVAKKMAVIAVAPPCYIDIATWRCGPIETGLAPRLAAALLAAPKVSPDVAAAVGEALAAVSDAQLPKPRVLIHREVKDVAPSPCLRLTTHVWTHSSHGMAGPGQRCFDLAQLSFDYGGARVIGDASAVNWRSGEEVLHIFRQLRAEHAARSLLKGYGLQLFPGADSLLGKSYDPSLGEPWTLPDAEAWLRFVAEVVPRLRADGWYVESSEQFRYKLVEADDEWQAKIEASGNDWFKLGLSLTVEGREVRLLPLLTRLLADEPNLFTPEGLKTLRKDARLMFRLDGERVLAVPFERVRHILGTLVELYQHEPGTPTLTLSRLDAVRLAELENGAPLRWLGGGELLQLGRRLKDFAGIRSVPPPQGFAAVLRPYQQQGLDWLQFLREYELAGILADDMGLGKTIQTLAHLLVEKQSGRSDRPSLVIAPTSLMHNWKAEAARFAPDLRMLILQGAARKKDFQRLSDYDVVLTTYPLLSRDKEVLLETEYHLLILDEAQNIKNAKSQAALISRRITARHRLCLTGTPMENHLGEMWALFNFLMPGLLGDQRQFSRLYRTPIEKHGDGERRRSLTRRVAPFLLRRSKEMVAAELPPKTEILRTVELAGHQRDLYETIRVAMHEKVREEVSAKGLARSHIVILDALLKLRQVCCDPRLVKLEHAKRVTESAKLDLLLTIVPELLDEGRRILLFSQFTSMLALIEEELHKRKIAYALLTGDTQDRKGAIEAFQSGKVPLFLISLKAGGVGLNLTAADTVIHYDPWWNPAVENQATDRAHRIGQDKPVFVYKLIAAGSVEEKIVALQARKAALAEGILSGKGEAVAVITKADLDVLFEPLADTGNAAAPKPALVSFKGEELSE
jgi:superfamily II DNA or RNA helicase